MAEDGQESSDHQDEQIPENVVEVATIDAADTTTTASKPRKKAVSVDRPYPRRTLEDALKVATAIREYNNGNPWPPGEVAKALGMGTGASFFYLTQAARDFGLTEGTREAANISLTDLGRKAVFPNNARDLQDAKLEAFNSIDLFRRVVTHYGGSNLPSDEFVRNTLQTQFNLDPRVHDEFLDLFRKNCRYVGIGADWKALSPVETGTSSRSAVPPVLASTMPSPIAVPPGKETGGDGGLPVCFVVMPFAERTDLYATGFFTEVFASLFEPAIREAGFRAKTAKRQGSDVIQATIMNELLDSDLVLCDLTEHNPNVLFELGVRMASELPIALVKATGTNPIFDVDQMLRVESYNPNLWPSTVRTDVPKIAAHIKEAYDTRHTQRSYMAILRQVTAPIGV